MLCNKLITIFFALKRVLKFAGVVSFITGGFTSLFPPVGDTRLAHEYVNAMAVKNKNALEENNESIKSVFR